MKIVENNIKDEYEIHISKEEFIEALSLLEKKHTQEKIADSISITAYEIVDEDGNIECSNCGGGNCWGNYCMDCGARMIGRQSAYEYREEEK